MGSVVRELHDFQELSHPVSFRGFAQPEMRHPFRHDRFPFHAGIERFERVLKDDLGSRPERGHLRARQREHVFAFEADFTAAGTQETKDQACQRRFAGARFANQRQRLSLLDRQGDILDRRKPVRRTSKQVVLDCETFAKTTYFEQRVSG